MIVTGTTTPAAAAAAAPRYSERLRPNARGWLWLPVVLAITSLAIAPLIAPVALAAWLVNLVRFWRVQVVVDDHAVRVGRRSAPLTSLDLTTLGRAQNTWPWRVFSRRWLGANPIWTRDSVGIRGFYDGKPVWVSVGTDRRDELVGVLEAAVPAARDRGPNAPVTVAGWHADPWDPTRLRWWDGAQWTGWTWPPTDEAGARR